MGMGRELCPLLYLLVLLLYTSVRLVSADKREILTANGYVGFRIIRVTSCLTAGYGIAGRIRYD